MSEKNPIYGKTVLNKNYKMIFTKRTQILANLKKGYLNNDSSTSALLLKRKTQNMFKKTK